MTRYTPTVEISSVSEKTGERSTLSILRNRTNASRSMVLSFLTLRPAVSVNPYKDIPNLYTLDASSHEADEEEVRRSKQQRQTGARANSLYRFANMSGLTNNLHSARSPLHPS